MAPTTRQSKSQTSLLSQKPETKISKKVPAVRRRNPRKLVPSFGNVEEDVLAHIFTYLPPRKLVQLSVMSKRFKETWRYCRNLVFGNDFYRRLSNRDEFVDVINHIMDSHIGEVIDSFHILMDPTDEDKSLSRWIKKALEKGTKVLDLDFDISLKPFAFPYVLMDSKFLRTVRLKYCIVTLPPVTTPVKGLRFLTTLVLRKVHITDFTIRRIFKNCWNLETLDMSECNGASHISFSTHCNKRFKTLKVGNCSELFYVDVDCPTLLSLHYSGTLQGLRILNNPRTSKLDDVMLNFEAPRTGITPHYLVERLLTHNISTVSVLTITSTVLEGATARMRNGVFASLNLCLWNLKELQVFMDNTSFCNGVDIADFVGKCPRLEKLFVDINNVNFAGDLYWQLHQKPFIDTFSTVFQNLKVMKVKGFKFLGQEIEMVRLFLRRSFQMEEMILVYPKNKDQIIHDIEPSNDAVFSGLFQNWKASPKVQILVRENSSDKTISAKHLRKWY
ncbi:putative FBD-associated F-box protein At1g61330 [Humulus lupulus]|uniref:putative FBD-associated F-box protein At1g61330 n=1 Tax=Humulus lupulus TaxID=3486 RepID=UPI002B40EF78|nr:putative FBD-associated F-box protein At1g61330 [Humulus lupulus]